MTSGALRQACCQEDDGEEHVVRRGLASYGALSVGELRSENGWSKVLAALDSRYRFHPETELNESVDGTDGLH